MNEWATAWAALRMSDSAGAIASTYPRPALVRATLRVVRLKRRTPRRFSRLATALPIAVGDISSSSAAARKLPSLAMATTASSSISPLLYIVTILSIRDRSLSQLSRLSKSVTVQRYSMKQGGWNAQIPDHQHHLRHHDARLPRVRNTGS